MQCNLCFWFSRIRNKFIKIQMHTSHLSFFITKKYWSAHLVSSFLNWYPSIYSSMAKLHDVCLKVLFSKEVILMAIGTHINEVNEQLFFHSHYKKNFYRHLTECKCNFLPIGSPGVTFWLKLKAGGGVCTYHWVSRVDKSYRNWFCNILFPYGWI